MRLFQQAEPFVERSVRTLKYECLWEAHPETPAQADDILREYRYFYNHERANQSSACQNRPPYEAFRNLPKRRALPEEVNPDAWLDHYHRLLFKRRVGSNGMVSIDRHTYYVGTAYTGQPIIVQLDAHLRQFIVIQRLQVIKQFDIQGLYEEPMSFAQYLKIMLEEARSIDRQHVLKSTR